MESAFAVQVEPGFSPAICAVASLAAPDRRFLNRGWYEVHGTGTPETVTLRDSAGDCVAAMPLAGSGPLRHLPGSYWPFRAFPVAETLDPARTSGKLRFGPATLAARIGPICEDDPALHFLRAAADGSPFQLLERPAGRCFVQDLTALTAAGPWPHASAIKRNAVRERRLAQQGPVTWQFASGAEIDARLFDAMAAVEAASWQGQGGGDRKFDPERRPAWERMADDPRVASFLSACLLRVGGRPAAFSFDLDVGSTRLGVCSGYDPRFAQASPGRLLHYRNMEAAIARGIRQINWGSGDSGYKRELGAVEGPRLLDCLLVRNMPGLVSLARRLWDSLDPQRGLASG